MEIAISWIAVSAAAVCCYWLKLRHAAHHGPTVDDWKRMQDDLDEMKQDLNGIYVDVTDRVEHLTDRLEFTERLLTQRTREPDEAEHTPV
jgi:hypothetical protein